MFTDNLEMRVSYNAYLWTGGGNQKTLRKPYHMPWGKKRVENSKDVHYLFKGR